MSRHAPARGGWRRIIAGERGAALALALVTLAGLTALALTLLAMSAVHPLISRNHTDLLRARYLAEAGLEYAFDTLASDAGPWDAHLTGATCTTGAVLAHSSLPGAGSAYGTFTVRVRNDCAPADERRTAVPLDAGNDAATHDTNGKVVVVSTGATAAIAQTVSAVISYSAPPVGPPGQSVSRGQVTIYSWADE